MANYTCEFSKIKDGDSTKYVQVPNENTAKRKRLVFEDESSNHTPLRNLDKYKITKTISKINNNSDGKNDNYINTTVTYSREFKSDIKNGEDIYCAFKQEDGNVIIYIKHDDLTSKEKEEAVAYDVYIRDDDDNENPTFTQDTATTYTFLWL